MTPDPPTQSTSSLPPSNSLTVWHHFLDNNVLIYPYLQTSVTAQPPPSRSLISQTPYAPPRIPRRFVAADPVSFSVNGVPGISISQAVAGEHVGLDGKDEGVSTFERSKTLFRIQVRTTTPRTSIPLMPYAVRWTPSAHIHGKEPSSQPAFVLLKRILVKHPP